MRSRDVDDGDRADSCPAPFGDLVLRTPANWTAVGFLGLLGGLHLAVSLPTVIGGRWEGYLSLLFGSAFVAIAAVSHRFRFELAVLPSQGRIRLRNGVGRFCAERFVPFKAIRGVRLTLCNDGDGRRPAESKIELLCPCEDVLCPPTCIPRQQALFLAMALNVPLTTVSDAPACEEEVAEPITETTSRRL